MCLLGVLVPFLEHSGSGGEAAARADHIEVSVVVFPIIYGIDKGEDGIHTYIVHGRPRGKPWIQRCKSFGCY
ncbi:unnamed protein product [Musa hybrid cultivar]